MQKPKIKKNESLDEYNERASKLYYENGYHVKEIAKRLDMDEIEVYNYVITKGHRITTEAERREMITLFNKGYSYTAIAKIFGKSRACIKDRIERPAKINRSGSGDLTDKQIKKIKEMAKNGAYLKTIAKELNIPVSAVRYRLSHGIRKPHHTYVTPAELNKMIRLYKKGKNQTEIAKLCNRGRSTVHNHLHKAGII